MMSDKEDALLEHILINLNVRESKQEIYEKLPSDFASLPDSELIPLVKAVCDNL